MVRRFAGCQLSVISCQFVGYQPKTRDLIPETCGTEKYGRLWSIVRLSFYQCLTIILKS